MIDGGSGDHGDNFGSVSFSISEEPGTKKASSGIAKTAQKKPVGKNDPFEGMKIDSEQISRVNFFIQSVEKNKVVDRALEKLTDSDKKLKSVQCHLKKLSEKRNFKNSTMFIPQNRNCL